MILMNATNTAPAPVRPQAVSALLKKNGCPVKGTGYQGLVVSAAFRGQEVEVEFDGRTFYDHVRREGQAAVLAAARVLTDAGFPVQFAASYGFNAPARPNTLKLIVHPKGTADAAATYATVAAAVTAAQIESRAHDAAAKANEADRAEAAALAAYEAAKAFAAERRYAADQLAVGAADAAIAADALAADAGLAVFGR